MQLRLRDLASPVKLAKSQNIELLTVRNTSNSLINIYTH